MTCKKNSMILVFMGATLLGLVGCESQPYKPWQPADSSWEKDDQADKQAAMTKAAEQATAAKQVPASTPVRAAEPVPMRGSPPVTEAEPDSEDMPVAQPMPRQADIKPAERASGARAPARTTGDVLLIDSIQSAPDIRTPRNGMNMDSVRRQFGNPLSEGSSIGDPPITRWEYKGFSVYFEHDLVLHSVTHRPNRN